MSLSKDVLESAIRRGLRNDSIVVRNVVTTIPTLAGDHYMSEVEYCDVDIDDGGVTRQVNLFVKKELNEEKVAKGLEEISTATFDREIKVYDVVLRDVIDYCRDRVNDLDFFPLCYHTDGNEKEKVIVMENLVHAGYKMNAEKIMSQDLDHCKLVMTSLATFHAATHAMSTKTGVDFLAKYDLVSVVQETTSPLHSLVPMVMTIAIKLLKTTPNCNEIAEKMEKFDLTVWNKFLQYFHPGKENLNVLCHGDCWNNNMMFSYDKDGNPVKVKLVDWQLAHVGVLGKDIWHYLYMSVKPEIRRKFQSEILRTYYDRFNNVLKSLDADDHVLTYDQFEKEHRAGKLFGLVMGVMSVAMSPVLAGVEKEKAEDADKDFDVSYLKERAQNLDISNLLSEKQRNDLVDMVKECEPELDSYLSTA